MNFIRLTTPDNRAVSVPAHAIFMLEGLAPGKNAVYPKARAFLYYDIGRGKQTVLVVNEFRSITDRLTKLTPRPWVRTTLPDNDPCWIAPERILHMMETTPEEREATEGLGLTNIDIRFGEGSQIGGISVNDPVEDLMAALEGRDTAREATTEDEAATPAARRSAQPRRAPSGKKGKKSEPPAGEGDEL